jgi:molybdopterin synthase catalytic subunit
MIEITEMAISPDTVISKVKSNGSGCVVTYVGLIRDNTHGKSVLSVSYQDVRGDAGKRLKEIAIETKQRWQIENIAISHRVGTLKVGDINLVVVVASAHRGEGFAACQYVIDRFKEILPTQKTETYV